MTWDRVGGFFGPDVAYIDLALGITFDRCAIDPARVCLAGFSDGASSAGWRLGLSRFFRPLPGFFGAGSAAGSRG